MLGSELGGNGYRSLFLGNKFFYFVFSKLLTLFDKSID